jgi:hypothetical protein
MDFQTYQDGLRSIEREAQNQRNELAKRYALSHNHVLLTHTFTDHIGTIRVEKIAVETMHGKPSCAYFGVELKKDGTPVKKETKRWAYQSNAKDETLRQPPVLTQWETKSQPTTN